MKTLLKKFYIKYIRKILNLRQVKSLHINFFPRLQTKSESIYINYKDPESKLLHILCDKNKTSLDIGTLWGGYTELMRKYSEKVYSFEPNAENHTFLVKSFINDKNVEIINTAVSNETDETKIRIPDGNPGNATISEKNKLENFENINEYIVNTVAVDDLEISNIGFIKIDIEGHELEALRGMQNTIIKERPFLLIEIEERHNKNSFSLVTSLMRDLEYYVYFLQENRLEIAVDVDLRNLQKTKKRSTSEYINNFIFVPKEKTRNFLRRVKKENLDINL